MNFFEAQDRTRRNTRWLIAIYFLCTVAIAILVGGVLDFSISLTNLSNRESAASAATVFNDPVRAVLLCAAVLTVILLGSAYRIMQLRGGGARVAQEMGATQISADVDDPLRQRLRNVVEEMAIASGVPVPDIFVMENESAINAFAAGFSTEDAAVAVTRGALEQLTREELQGVIGHEFSHILNGDMRLNVRLMGILFGMIIIGQLGRLLIRSAGRRGAIVSRDRNSGSAPFVFVGIALFILGSVGVLAARLIRAGVSRQREYLADASAVQFTRQTEGIAGALAKIGGLKVGSRLRTVDTEEVSHMLIARGAKAAWFGAMASHPPVEERIRQLNPSFLVKGVPTPRARPSRQDNHALISALHNDAGLMNSEAVDTTARVAAPGDSEIALAAAIRTGIPAELYDAAHSREWSYVLALALSLSSDDVPRERQLRSLHGAIGEQRCERVRRYAEQLDEIGSRFRLPLLELCFPALKQRPAGQLEVLLTLIDNMHGLTREPDLRDTVFRTTLAVSLDGSINPGRSERWRTTHLGRTHTKEAAATLIWLVARYGHDNPKAAGAAFRSGIATLGTGGVPQDTNISVSESANALASLRGLIGRDMKLLLDALVETISHDGQITVAESEFMRMISVALNCPLPPIVDSRLAAILNQD